MSMSSRVAKAEEARQITARARRERRSLTEAEFNRVDALLRAAKVADDTTLQDGGFVSFGEFVSSLRFRGPGEPRPDPRLKALQQMDDGAKGGFAVPRQFVPGLRAVDPAEATIRPRATVIDPDPVAPDAPADLAMLDQGEDGFLGGVMVQRFSEADGPDKTVAEFKGLNLVPHDVGAFLEVTDKLLRNWRTSGPDIERTFRWAMTEQEEVDFLFGDGDGEPLGALHADNEALISIPRAAAGAVAYTDVLAMDRAFYGRAGIWMAGRDAFDSMAQMRDMEGKLLWPSLAWPNAEGSPPMLLGKPLIRHDSMPLDALALVDWTYYAIKDGFGPAVRVGVQGRAHWTKNLSIVRCIFAYDGKPMLTQPIKTRAGATVSPFVTLGDAA